MRFCEASAKDNFNVDEIFLKLVDDILKKVKKKKRNYIMKVSSETCFLYYFLVVKFLFQKRGTVVFFRLKNQVKLSPRPEASRLLLAAAVSHLSLVLMSSMYLLSFKYGLVD